MDYTTIEAKVKYFVIEQYENAKRYPRAAVSFRDTAYGAVQFAADNLFPCYNLDLADWWGYEMSSKFTAIEENEND